MPNENHIIRRINTNKTQILHRIRLKKFIPNQPLEDNFREQRLQSDEEIVIPQDDLHIITWGTDFCAQLVTREHNPIPTSLQIGKQPSTAEPIQSVVEENEADYIITRDETSYADHAAHSRNERLTDDVNKRHEAREAIRNEEPDWPNPAVYPRNQEKTLPNTDERLENDENFSDKYLINENDATKSPNMGDDIIVPKYRKTMLETKI